ncbi:hypothetical protein Celgi_0590 [Cellulomonas gilvus ATCC 13127]|uniref:Uncharacterized protein n=2 Tax=Cellulomonas gilvus TaxID=11 RepID=F8A6Q0_CELGA|nr:hypothetical protein Celgi_0590 [Cellulomonas gilvus ATCC 13127]
MTGATSRAGSASRTGYRMVGGRHPLTARLVVVVTLALVAACTGPDNPAPPEPTGDETSQPGPVPTAASSATPAPGGVGELAVVDVSNDNAGWTAVDVPDGFMSTIAATDDVLVGTIQDSAGSESAFAMLASGDVRTLPGDAGEIPQQGSVRDDGSAVFGVGNDDTSDYRVVHWDPVSGKSRVLLESPGIWSETAVVDDTLYLNRPHDDGLVCLDQTSVARPGEPTTVECAAEGGRINYVKVADDDTLTYMVYPDDGECGAVHGITPQQSAALRGVDCISRAVADRNLVAWTGAPETSADGVNYFKSPLRALDEGRIYDLGETSVGGAAICHGAGYWTTDGAGGPEEVRRWKPGSDIEVIYRSPDKNSLDSYTTSMPFCGGSTVLIQRIGWTGRSKQELLTSSAT